MTMPITQELHRGRFYEFGYFSLDHCFSIELFYGRPLKANETLDNVDEGANQIEPAVICKGPFFLLDYRKRNEEEIDVVILAGNGLFFARYHYGFGYNLREVME